MKKLLIIPLLLVYLTTNTSEYKRKEVILDEIVVKSYRLPQYIIDHIKEYESFSPVKYKLSTNNIIGYFTTYIGYGHAVVEGEVFKDTISELEAEELLVKDFNNIKNIINRSGNLEMLTDKQILAISLLAYNCGPYKIKKWSLWDSIIKGGDCSIWLNYCFFNKKRHKGLKRRREFEYKLFKN